MKDTKIFFISGFPRAGNTLLASLLNQNPDIGACPNGLPMEAMKELFLLHNDEVFQNFPDYRSLSNLMDIVYPTYFKDWNYKYIFDRAPAGTPGNLMMLKKHLKQPIKIIVLVRPILEVLASFIKWANKEPTAYINKLSGTVRQCQFLMRKEGQIYKEVVSLENLLKPENRHHALFIKYHDLVKNPLKTLNKIYQFFEIPKFKHKLIVNQLKVNGQGYDDTITGKGLHTLRKRIKLQKTNVRKLLPPEIIKAYGHLKWKIV